MGPDDPRPPDVHERFALNTLRAFVWGGLGMDRPQRVSVGLAGTPVLLAAACSSSGDKVAPGSNNASSDTGDGTVSSPSAPAHSSSAAPNKSGASWRASSAETHGHGTPLCAHGPTSAGRYVLLVGLLWLS
jgi:hypothetical protein